MSEAPPTYGELEAEHAAECERVAIPNTSAAVMIQFSE